MRAPPYTEEEISEFAIQLYKKKSYFDAYQIAFPERAQKSKASRKNICSLAKKISLRPEVQERLRCLKEKENKKQAEFFEETIKQCETKEDKAVVEQILTRREYWLNQTRIFYECLSGSGKYSEQMYMHVSKCFFEKFKSEPTEESEKAVEKLKNILDDTRKEILKLCAEGKEDD